jgi:hypothetical protein
MRILEGTVLYDEGVLVDLSTGVALASEDDEKDAEGIEKLLYGDVLDAGLGLGHVRARLERSAHVTSVQSCDSNGDVVKLWKSGKVGPTQRGVPRDGSQKSPVETADVRQVLKRNKRWHSAVFSVWPTSIYHEESFRTDLRNRFDALGDRVVILTEEADLEIPGFKVTTWGDRLPSGLWVRVLDRWDPVAGLGEDVRSGQDRLVNQGWVSR